MSDYELSLLDIETSLPRLRRSLRFDAKIEAVYEAQTQQIRARAMNRVIRSSLITYNALCLADYLVLPKTLWWAIALHLLLVTTVSLAAGVVICAKPQRIVRESLAVLMPILMFVQVMTIYVMNHGAAADSYQYLAVLIVILTNSILRLDFRFAVATSIGIATAYLALIWIVGRSPLPAQVIGTIIMVSVVYTTLVARRLMERDARHGFLRRSQGRLQRDAIEAIARRDELTGLFNRRYLDERFQTIWNAPNDDAPPVAVLMIDVDLFKMFNDGYGHLAGDTCLTRVAGAILAQLSRKDDIAVRFGGEEFLVLLARTDLTDALRVAHRIRVAIEDLGIPHEASSCGVVTASVGVTAGAPSTDRASDLIAAADTALYAAKHAGRNRVWPPFVNADGLVAPSMPMLARQGT